MKWIPSAILYSSFDDLHLKNLIVNSSSLQPPRYTLCNTKMPDFVYKDCKNFISPPSPEISHPMLNVPYVTVDGTLYWSAMVYIENRHEHDINSELLFYGLYSYQQKEDFLIQVMDESYGGMMRYNGSI